MEKLSICSAIVDAGVIGYIPDTSVKLYADINHVDSNNDKICDICGLSTIVLGQVGEKNYYACMADSHGKWLGMDYYIFNDDRLCFLTGTQTGTCKGPTEIVENPNDDKIYNIKDVLYICKTLNIPMVLDYHHFICNNEGENINDYLLDIFNTWQNKTPKIHFSTPKSKLKKEFRSHNDYIDCDDFISFINILKNINRDVDIMLEAKAKDDALFRLVRCLKYKTNYNFIDESSFYV